MIEPQPYPFTLKQAVPDSFCEYVNALIQSNIEHFEGNQAGAARKFMKMDYVSPDGDQVLYEMKQKLAQQFDLGEYVVPPNLKDFVGYITEGGEIHPHTDPDLPGKRHVRINVLVSQPGGCVPLLENIPIVMSVGDAWLNLASQVIHATTPVTGPGFRSAISFGYQIDPKRGDAFFDTHKGWMNTVRKVAALKAGSETDMATSRKDVQAVEAATDLLSRGLSTSDISSITDLVTETTLVMPAGRRTFKGQAVVEFWRNFALANESVRMLSTDVDTLAEGLVRDVGTLCLRAKRDGEQTLFRYIVLWQKVGDVWTVATMTWNREVAPGGRS